MTCRFLHTIDHGALFCEFPGRRALDDLFGVPEQRQSSEFWLKHLVFPIVPDLVVVLDLDRDHDSSDAFMRS